MDTDKHALEGLDQPLSDLWTGKPLQLDGKDLDVKRGLVVALVMYKCEPATSIQAFSVATKLMASNGSCDLTGPEYALLKTAVEKNGPGFGAVALAQIWRLFV